MEATLKRLCDQHRLTSISAMLFTTVKIVPVTVYVHWDEHECVGGNGNTFEEALACALGQMAERRREAA
jgi:hypothetical protein